MSRKNKNKNKKTNRSYFKRILKDYDYNKELRYFAPEIYSGSYYNGLPVDSLFYTSPEEDIRIIRVSEDAVTILGSGEFPLLPEETKGAFEPAIDFPIGTYLYDIKRKVYIYDCVEGRIMSQAHWSYKAPDRIEYSPETAKSVFAYKPEGSLGDRLIRVSSFSTILEKTSVKKFVDQNFMFCEPQTELGRDTARYLFAELFPEKGSYIVGTSYILLKDLGYSIPPEYENLVKNVEKLTDIVGEAMLKDKEEKKEDTKPIRIEKKEMPLSEFLSGGHSKIPADEFVEISVDVALQFKFLSVVGTSTSLILHVPFGVRFDVINSDPVFTGAPVLIDVQPDLTKVEGDLLQ